MFSEIALNNLAILLSSPSKKISIIFNVPTPATVPTVRHQTTPPVPPAIANGTLPAPIPAAVPAAVPIVAPA